MEEKSKVYILTDDRNLVIRLDGGYSIGNVDTATWILIDEGYGDKYNLCQNHYLQKPVCDDRGIPQFKFINSKIVERTQEEMDADYVPPITIPSQADRTEAQALFTALITDTLLEEQ